MTIDRYRASTAKSGRAKQLVVFLHGYGADGKDLIELGQQWRALLPDAAFVAPNAPERCPGAPMGRQWFALSRSPPDDPRGAAERWKGCAARPAIDAFLDEELARLGLDECRLALVGFSQGAMMALHVGLRRPRAPAAIVGYSGMLIGPEQLAEATARERARRAAADPARPWRSGRDDPVRGHVRRRGRIRRGRDPDQWHLSMGVGHGIDAGGLNQAGAFLVQSLSRRRR